ncbi:hypothetical protein [Halpernia sp.]|uniref:hypothetical protein n=1 Tax=Halpernia sp. TaxID=2782209 RepID=UPI003A903DAB
MNKNEPRFQDQHLRLADFNQEVWVVCPQCSKKAIAKANEENARLFCNNCGYQKETSLTMLVLNQKVKVKMAAHFYFDAELWLQLPFKNDVFYAYNLAHLDYLEQYISAKLREHKDRTHFTLLEKLPKFYHEAKNRDALLKLIEKLKKK